MSAVNSKGTQASLTTTPQEQARKATGKEAETLELGFMELEERIAPGYRMG